MNSYSSVSWVILAYPFCFLGGKSGQGKQSRQVKSWQLLGQENGKKMSDSCGGCGHSDTPISIYCLLIDKSSSGSTSRTDANRLILICLLIS